MRHAQQAGYELGKRISIRDGKSQVTTVKIQGKTTEYLA